MNAEAAIPSSLLVHDGELADVRALLDEIGVPFVERLRALDPEDTEEDWGLVIASPQNMLRLYSVSAPTRIAVMSQDSRTLRNSLRRAGIQLLVRRPVHPATMRALVVHALYRGPEKRRMQRVNIGAPVSFRVGWRQRPAVLVDLSLVGCRLLTDRRLQRQAPLALHLPAEITGDKGFSVKGSVLKSEPAGVRQFSTSARFAELKTRTAERLQRTVAAHADGPAVFDGAPPLADPAELAAPRPCNTPRPMDAPPPSAPLQPAPLAKERRAAPRHQLERRVISLSEEATRVLMGRDITVGGMRVDPNPTLQLGADLLLAVHAAGQETPLVVRAKVHRDDRERGMVLRFHELSPEATRYLNHAMDHLPLLEADDDESGCLVTEILEAS
jgi:hypothetical protein